MGFWPHALPEPALDRGLQLAPPLNHLLCLDPKASIDLLFFLRLALPLHTLFVAILPFRRVLPLPGSPGQPLVLLLLTSH